MAACAKLSTQFPCQGKHENIALLSLLVIFFAAGDFFTPYWWKLWSGICRGFTSFTFSSSLNLLPARGGTLCSTWQSCSTPRDMTALDTHTLTQYTPHTPSPAPSSHFTLLLPILRSLRASTSTPSLPSSVLHSSHLMTITTMMMMMMMTPRTTPSSSSSPRSRDLLFLSIH